MIRFVATVLVASTLCTSAFADGLESHATPSQASVDPTAGGEGLVPLRIDVTEARRVMVRDSRAASGLRYV